MTESGQENRILEVQENQNLVLGVNDALWRFEWEDGVGLFGLNAAARCSRMVRACACKAGNPGFSTIAASHNAP
jgi:hypothetical protein